MFRLILLSCLSVVYAQLEVNGACDFTKVPYQKDFVLSIVGTWYQIERIPNSVENGDCAHANLTIRISNLSVPTGTIYNSEVVDGKLVLRNAAITIDEEGVWNLTYNDGTSQNVVILGTDFNEYLMLYSCQDDGNRSKISAWKLGRSTTYSDNAINRTQTLAQNANIANTSWKVVQHTEAACKITNNGAMNLQMSPVLFLLLALIGVKQLY